MDFSSFLNFLYGILAGIISALFISRFIEPGFDFLVDGLKSSQGISGTIYRKYIHVLNKVFYVKKLHPSLENVNYEYKIYITNGELKSCCSEIVTLRQTFLKQIQGEMKRLRFSGNTNQTFFKGYIKLQDSNYLIWDERYKSNEGNFHITARYKLLDENNKDIIGISIEEDNGQVVECLSIISNEIYNTVRKISQDNPQVISYLNNHNLDLSELTPETNKFKFYS